MRFSHSHPLNIVMKGEIVISILTNNSLFFVGFVFVNRLVRVVVINATRTFEAELTMVSQSFCNGYLVCWIEVFANSQIPKFG